MRVGMRQRLVAMPVAVLHRGGEPGMLVGVVTVVMAVSVHVFDFAVDVVVLVLGAHDRRNRRHQQRRARELRDGDRLAEDAPGKRGSRKRRDGEERLRARRAELLRRRDVERDAGAIADCPDRESARCGRGRSAARRVS